jgi:UDP-N-acetylmuramoylalanine--D-glutamate ligase
MKTLILGFGKTGQSVRMNDSIIYDDKAPIDIPWGDVDLVIQSAGIPLHHPVSQEAQNRKIPIKTDLDLFFEQYCPGFVIGITGTNGKSTVTAMIAHMLKEQGLKVEMGGNIGIPVLDLKRGADFYILELSSYQLALSQIHHLDIGIWTNTSPDHLEWHLSFDNYVKAKSRLSAKIIITNDLIAKSFYSNTSYHFYQNENLSLVYSVGLELGLTSQAIERSIATFQDLAHRQEVFEKTKDIVFINDSKATNLESVNYAFKALRLPIFWIAGGRAKQKGLTGLKFDGVQKAYYIGESAHDFHQDFPGLICPYLEKATQMAYQDALKFNQPCAVLLSPGCASFDQFKNFEERGDVFKACVKALIAQS